MHLNRSTRIKIERKTISYKKNDLLIIKKKKKRFKRRRSLTSKYTSTKTTTETKRHETLYYISGHSPVNLKKFSSLQDFKSRNKRKQRKRVKEFEI